MKATGALFLWGLGCVVFSCTPMWAAEPERPYRLPEETRSLADIPELPPPVWPDPSSSSTTAGGEAVPLGNLQLTQATAPPTPPPSNPTPSPALPTAAAMAAAQGQNPSGQGPARGGETAVSFAPNMIGDTGGGSCGGLTFSGVLRVSLEHPTFGCSRLNIAEDNSPVPRDRFYFRYNHFENETTVDIFSDSVGGAKSNLNIEQFTFGVEKTFFDGLMSVELRVPFAEELTSNISLFDVQGVSNLPFNKIDTEFGNVSLLYKLLLFSSRNLSVSSGFGVNFPTSRDVTIKAHLDDNNFLISGPGVPVPPNTRGAIKADFSGKVANQSFNMSPFMGLLWTPTPRFFFQNFIQFDCPLNPTEASVSGSASLSALNGQPIGPLVFPFPPVSGQISQQFLGRFNFGTGYWILRNPQAPWITGLASMVELHYTTTLNDAQLLSKQIPFFQNIGPTLTVGNLANRVDVLDLTLGSTIEVANRTTLTAGIVLPLRQGDDKPFDYEVTIQLNHRFGYRSRAAQAPEL